MICPANPSLSSHIRMRRRFSTMSVSHALRCTSANRACSCTWCSSSTLALSSMAACSSGTSSSRLARSRWSMWRSILAIFFSSSMREPAFLASSSCARRSSSSRSAIIRSMRSISRLRLCTAACLTTHASLPCQALSYGTPYNVPLLLPSLLLCFCSQALRHELLHLLVPFPLLQGPLGLLLALFYLDLASQAV